MASTRNGPLDHIRSLDHQTCMDLQGNIDSLEQELESKGKLDFFFYLF